jgi:hypothetical protein
LSQQPGSSKTKELKMVSKQVITKSSLKEDRNKLKLLQLIKMFSPISERSLQLLVYELKQRGVEVDYSFTNIAGNITSLNLREDLTALLYLGLVENDPVDKRLKLTGDGEQVVTELIKEPEFEEKAKQLAADLKPKIQAIDQEENLKMRKERRMLRRR